MTDTRIDHVIDKDLKVNFRRAEKSDLANLKSLYKQLIPNASPDEAFMDKELSEILSHPHRGWISVCLQQDQVIATCQTVIYSNLIRAPFSKAVIDSVVVDEGFRNRGIGYALMEWTMELLHKERCERVMVSTAFSRTVAHRLYEGMGFDQFGYTYLKVLED